MNNATISHLLIIAVSYNYNNVVILINEFHQLLIAKFKVIAFEVFICNKLVHILNYFMRCLIWDGFEKIGDNFWKFAAAAHITKTRNGIAQNTNCDILIDAKLFVLYSDFKNVILVM